MGWLLAKDLRILRRSPMMVALLVLYPVIIATLIGFALSRGPDKPKVAVANLVPRTDNTISLGGKKINLARQAGPLFNAVSPVNVKTRAEAIKKVRNGEVLAALVIPADTTQKLQTGLDSGRIEVFYNAEDPVKADYVRNTIKSQVQDANTALTRELSGVALQFLDLISTGGEYNFIGQHFNVLGLRKSEQILRSARADLPRGSPARKQVDDVIAFAELARSNLKLSDDVLGSVSSPIKVRQVRLNGSSTPLSSLAVAVSLMFITLLLAAGALALEREENAYLRLVRGLVSRTGLLLEKAGLAAVCSTVVSLLMLAGLGLFLDLSWGRAPLWLVAAGAGSLAFAAMGLAVGALTREVRAASLLCVMASLPLTFLALVPSGAVAPTLFDVVRVISALFPFKPTLDALNSAINASGGIGLPLLHLALLFVAYASLSRLALRRFV